MTFYPLLKKNMSKGAAFYKLSMYVYLAIAGGVSVFFNALRNIGNYPVTNGIGTSNKSLSAIVMFIALYIGFGKYVRQKDLL